MNGRCRFLYIIIAGILMSFQSAIAGTQVSDSAKITQLFVGDETVWYVGTDIDLGGCSNPLLVLDPASMTHYKELYSTLLAAYISQKSVTFYFSDSCLWGGGRIGL